MQFASTSGPCRSALTGRRAGGISERCNTTKIISQRRLRASTKLVQLVPASGPAWSFLGLCEFETRDYSNALSHLEKAQTLGGGDDQELARVSAYHRALLLIRNSEFERASTLLGAMFGQGEASEQVKVALGLALLRIPLLPEEVDPSQDALVHAAGEVASVLAQGDSAKALDGFSKLSAEHPSTPYLHYAYGIALAAAGRVDEALAEQRREMKVSPNSALPLIQIAALELQLQHPQEARQAAEKAVQLAPHSSAAHQALSKSLRAVGEVHKADERTATGRESGRGEARCRGQSPRALRQSFCGCLNFVSAARCRRGSLHTGEL